MVVMHVASPYDPAVTTPRQMVSLFGGTVPPRTRQQIDPTDDWQQLRLLTSSTEQLTYELIRPVVLFGQSPAERARETSAPARTLYRQVARFESHGMASLFPAPAEPHRRVPMEIRQAIVDLKAEYPPFRPNEIATICEVRFGYHPDLRTVRRVLAEEPGGAFATRRYPPYHTIPDPAERRLPSFACTVRAGISRASPATSRRAARRSMPPCGVGSAVEALFFCHGDASYVSRMLALPSFW